MIDTITEHAETEALLRAYPAVTISFNGAKFTASCYEPNDILRGEHCYGSGSSLANAFAGMLAEVEKAKATKKKLRTAAECKAAVIGLIREHDAAPAAFRDAVDGLDVA